MKLLFITFLIIFVAAVMINTDASIPSDFNFNLMAAIGGLLAYEWIKNLFVILAGGLIIFLLIKVKANKWLFMSLLVGALWMGIVIGGVSLWIAGIVVIFGILGVFRFIFSKVWEKTTEFGENGISKTTERTSTQFDFRGDGEK